MIRISTKAHFTKFWSFYRPFSFLSAPLTMGNSAAASWLRRISAVVRHFEAIIAKWRRRAKTFLSKKVPDPPPTREADEGGQAN
jgi:hypothetical protein